MKFFSVDGTFYRFMNKLLDVLKLNFLWLLGALPIVTIGASTTAAMDVAMEMVKDQEGSIAHAYWESYKANFKSGLPLGLVLLIAWYAVYLDFELFNNLDGNPLIFLIAGILSAFLVAIVTLYAFPLNARYQNSLVRLIRISIDVALQYYGRTLLMLILCAIWVLLFRWNSTMLFLGFLFCPGCVIMTVAWLTGTVFDDINRINEAA